MRLSPNANCSGSKTNDIGLPTIKVEDVPKHAGPPPCKELTQKQHKEGKEQLRKWRTGRGK